MFFDVPYHGWTYSLDGALKGTPDFAGVCDFDRAANGLVPLEAAVWENWVFVRVNQAGASLPAFLGASLLGQVKQLHLESLHWMERRRYMLDCNWKVFIDNYLDGGYHVPHLHKGLDSVLDYSEYAIEIGERFCLQSSPMVAKAPIRKRLRSGVGSGRCITGSIPISSSTVTKGRWTPTSSCRAESTGPR